MKRRHYLATAGAGLLWGLAGTPDVGERESAEATGTSGADPDVEGLAAGGSPAGPLDADALPVPESELARAAPRDGIPAIVDPVFGEDWTALPDEGAHAGRELRPDDEVLGIAAEGHARAYPLKVLSRHEAVNDTFGEPIVATYCPVCKSGVVASRHVADRTRTFGVSGFLFRTNLVLYDDASGSLWSQLSATAIRGPLTGTVLSVRPSTTTTWREWRAEYPDTGVLLPPPASGTVVGDVSFNYELDIYERHEQVAARNPEYGLLGDLEWTDTRLRRRDRVLGVAVGDEARAYARHELRSEGPINDVVGGRPVVVTAASEDSMLAYDRRVDGETRTFTDAGDSLAAGGSQWRRLSGRAIDGPHEGTTLAPAPAHGPLFFAAWLQFYPETTVYGHDG